MYYVIHLNYCQVLFVIHLNYFNEVCMSIGKRLGEERDRLGFSQEDLGEIGGVKKNAQFQYEKDKRSPSAD